MSRLRIPDENRSFHSKFVDVLGPLGVWTPLPTNRHTPPRGYFNMLTAGADDPAVIRFAPAVITFYLRNAKNVIQYFAC